MSEPDRFVIIGAGGQGAEALWVARASSREGFLGFLDADPELAGKEVLGAEVLGAEDDFIAQGNAGVGFHCAIGNNGVRKAVAEKMQAAGLLPVTLIHPHAIVTEDVEIGAGTYIGAGTVVSIRARLGMHTLVNLNVTVGHDAVVGDYAQLCPGARVNGCCQVGAEALIGSNAVIEPGKSVGSGATLAACSFATDDVQPGETALGIPARAIFRKS
ncbi:MAG: acetyltransferase [Verrucomicrobiota bacterium]